MTTRGWRRVAVLIAVGAVAVSMYFVYDLFRPGVRYQVVDLREIGAFAMDPQAGSIADVPAAFRALDGKQVAVPGQIYAPTAGSGKDTDFAIVYDLTGSGQKAPHVQERIYATVPCTAGKNKLISGDWQWISGTLHVRVEHEPISGSIISVYKLDVDRIEGFPPPRTIGNSFFALLQPWQQGVFAAAFLVVVAWAFWAIHRMRLSRQRTRDGAQPCPVCGYDLRASTGRCPECGALITSPLQRGINIAER